MWIIYYKIIILGGKGDFMKEYNKNRLNRKSETGSITLFVILSITSKLIGLGKVWI